MTIELKMLLWSTLLAFVQNLMPLFGNVYKNGLGWALGNRDNSPPWAVWPRRAFRARTNMLENLIIFAFLVIVAALAGISTPMTVLGAQLFFYGRVAHAICYLVGIPYARTLAWLVSVVGMGMILSALI
ncbi:MAG TPA: MAPEG family protein [Alphaproteobacteria bacterium]|nr:MAPEG family protein [Alphaproteobacteria bacterium]